MPDFLPDAGYDPVNAKKRARSIVKALRRTYPDARTSLTYEDPFQLLVATILSAQSTDETVNRVAPKLFARYPTPAKLAAAKPDDVEKVIYPTGFFRQKTKSIIGAARKITEDFGGNVPLTIRELTTLPGVARKTANVVITNIAPKAEGIFVDTHIRRVSQRLALTAHNDPVKIERDLMELLPRDAWVDTPHQMILLGRGPCNARNPDHASCPLLRWCPTGQAALAGSAPTRSVRRAAGVQSGDRGKPKPARRTGGDTSTGRLRRT
jgi:endonuclease III